MSLPVTRRALLRSVTGGVAAIQGLGRASAAIDAGRDTLDGPTGEVPEAAAGFLTSPLVPLRFPTALQFGPGEAGPDLYATTLAGRVVRVHLEWTERGPLVIRTSTAADGFTQPLGIAFYGRGPPEGSNGTPPEDRGSGPKADAMLVSDSHTNERTGRTDGRVVVVEETDRRVVVDGLPNGRHNTNHLAFGPDDRLYVTNGNTTDDGCEGGDPEVLPYSGAILAVSVDDVEDEPAVLRWVDDDGERIPPGEIPDHEVNEAFAETVDVVAHGFRNVYGVAFGPDGVPYTGMNGADDPASPDVFYRLDEPAGTDYGYPYCFNVGPAGATGDEVAIEPNPADHPDDCHVFQDPPAGCDYPTAEAVMGWHVCATGLDFPTDGPFAFPDEFRGDAFVGECGTFSPAASMEKNLESGSSRNTGHKVARIGLDGGDAEAVRDFVTGLSLPTDVVFGPQGAMYVADLEGVYRVQPTAD